MKPEGLIYKDYVGEIKEVNEKDGTVTAFVSTNSIDRQGEVLDPQGADLSNYRKNPVVLWAHDYATPPIGRALWAKKSGNGILSKMEFAPTDFAQEIKALYAGGYMNSFSVGFIPKTWVDGKSAKEPSRIYTGWEMLEYSAVPVPANPDAVSLAISKGVLKNQALKDILIPTIEGGWDEDTKTSSDAQTIIVPAKNELNELMTELKTLQEQICYLEKDNQELRYKLYALLKQNQKKLSEIADDDFVAKTHEIIVGAIRKAQGKIT